jgi:predicted glycogen debranching enzyme
MTAQISTITLTADALQNEGVFRREWLVTNGLGGYASASLATANTRRYHGLLVAALNPPLGRTVLLSKLEETLEIVPKRGEAQAFPLSANIYPDAVHPQGHCALESWSSHPAPTWVWSPAPDVRIEKKVWMPQGRNTVYITYRLLAAPKGRRANLRFTPLLAWKDYHSEMKRADSPEVEWQEGERTLRVTVPPIWKVTTEPRSWTLAVQSEDGSSYPGAEFAAGGDWYYRFQHPREQERGLDFEEDLYAPGTFTAPLAVGEALVVVASVETEAELQAAQSWEALLTRQQTLLDRAKARDTFAQQLTLAADQFVVQVPHVRDTVIAGYPWFSDWGRDTMIALPGLCLTTGRAEIARDILLSFAAYLDRGMLPNRFPDAGTIPEYNTVDATLWYFAAIYHYIAATDDRQTLQDSLWPVLERIVQYHLDGTRYHIHADPVDRLIYAGEPGVQLTWMDAKVGDWVVTPRIGKPVEINALWHNALRTMAHFAELLDKQPEVATYTDRANEVAAKFTERFARPDGLGLYDVLDTPGLGADASIRPNQIFALSLPFAPLDAKSALARAVVDTVQTELVTPCGLRTLSPRDSSYRPRYEGDPWSRDGAYHQGTVWPWLLGPFTEAHFKVYGDKVKARGWLMPLQQELSAFGVGSLAEVYDGSDPQRPNGCIAQAWSVAETLRVWKELE